MMFLLTRQEAENAVRSIRRTCMGPRTGSVPVHFIPGVTTTPRIGCGYDVNDLICQFPFDGGFHTAKCPKCGQAITFKSPVFATDDA